MKSTKLTYIGAYDAVDTKWGTAVRGGDPVEFPADMAQDLVDRGDFARPTTNAAAKAAEIPHAPVDPSVAVIPPSAEKE